MNEKMLKAFCRRDGLIMLADVTPEGAYGLASAPATLLAQAVDATAIAAFDSSLEGMYFVPGVPDTPCERTALECVFDYQTELNKRLSRCLASHAGHSTVEVHSHVSAASRI